MVVSAVLFEGEMTGLFDRRVLLAFVLGLLVSGVPLGVYCYVLSRRTSGSENPGNEIADLELTIKLDKTVYTLGEPVNVTLTLTNIGDRNVTLVFPKPTHFHINFCNATKDLAHVVYFSPGVDDQYEPVADASAMISYLRLEPGESRVVTCSWLPTRAGTYYVQGGTQPFGWGHDLLHLATDVIEFEIV